MNDFSQWKSDVRGALLMYIRTHPTSIAKLATALKINKHTLTDFISDTRKTQLYIVGTIEQFLIKQGHIVHGK